MMEILKVPFEGEKMYSKTYREFGTPPKHLVTSLTLFLLTPFVLITVNATQGDGMCLREGGEVYKALHRMQDTWR